MTTERASDDQAARLAVLQQRRAGRTPPPPTRHASVRTAEPGRPAVRRPRRRHAAAGARILVGTLSAASALGLVGAMAGGLPTTTVTAAGVEQRSSITATQTAAAPPVAASFAKPATSSQGS